MLRLFASFYIFSCILALGNISTVLKDQAIWKMTNFKLIIPGNIAENQGKIKTPSSEVKFTDPKEDETIKKKTCRSIFSTPYFTKNGDEWFDVDAEENREFLKLNHIQIFNLIFKEPEKKGLLSPLLGNKPSYEYQNPYKAGGLYTRLNIVELSGYPMVFICLVQQTTPENKKIVEYFVSKPFYVSFPEYNANDIPGRFVFSGKEKMTLEVFAADSTNVKSEFNVNVNDRSGLGDLAMLDSMFGEAGIQEEMENVPNPSE